MDLLLVPCVLPIVSSLLLPCVSAYCSLAFQLIAPLHFSSPLMGLLLFPISHEAVPPLVYKAPC